MTNQLTRKPHIVTSTFRASHTHSLTHSQTHRRTDLARVAREINRRRRDGLLEAVGGRHAVDVHVGVLRSGADHVVVKGVEGPVHERRTGRKQGEGVRVKWSTEKRGGQMTAIGKKGQHHHHQHPEIGLRFLHSLSRRASPPTHAHATHTRDRMESQANL